MRNAGRLAEIKVWPVAMAALVYLWFLLDGHQRLIGPDPLAWF